MNRTRAIAVTGFLTALSVILTRFASFRLPIGGIEGVRIGFGSMPSIIAGVFLGPWYGAAAGALSDLLGHFLSPMGAYMPHFTLAAALMGAIPGFVFCFLNAQQERARASIFQLGLATFVGIAVVSWGVTPYFLHRLFGFDYRVIMPPRIIAGIAETLSYAFVLRAIYSPIARIAPRIQTSHCK